MSVVEIVQTMELGRKTARVDVTPTVGTPGTLACSNGQVVFARTAGLSGEDAFYVLSVHREGFFRIHFGDEPAERNIERPTTFLLLEALRRVDEAANRAP